MWCSGQGDGLRLCLHNEGNAPSQTAKSHWPFGSFRYNWPQKAEEDKSLMLPLPFEVPESGTVQRNGLKQAFLPPNYFLILLTTVAETVCVFLRLVGESCF